MMLIREKILFEEKMLVLVNILAFKKLMFAWISLFEYFPLNLNGWLE